MVSGVTLHDLMSHNGPKWIPFSWKEFKHVSSTESTHHIPGTVLSAAQTISIYLSPKSCKLEAIMSLSLDEETELGEVNELKGIQTGK